MNSNEELKYKLVKRALLLVGINSLLVAIAIATIMIVMEEPSLERGIYVISLMVYGFISFQVYKVYLKKLSKRYPSNTPIDRNSEP